MYLFFLRRWYSNKKKTQNKLFHIQVTNSKWHYFIMTACWVFQTQICGLRNQLGCFLEGLNFLKVREFFYEYKRKKVRRKFPWFFGKIYFKSYYRLNFWENIWRFLVSSINFELFEEFDFARTLEWANLVNYQILRATNFILNLFVETPTLKKSNNKALLSRVYWHRAPSHQSENSIPFRVSLFNADLLSKKGAYTLQQFSYLQYILTICLFCKFFIFCAIIKWEAFINQIDFR